VSDATDVEDVDSTGEDHAADESRYVLMSMPIPGESKTVTPLAPDSWGAMKAGTQPPAGILSGREVRVA
jgi:hypothetical protein